MSLSSADKTSSKESRATSGRVGARASARTIGSVSRRGMDSPDDRARRTSDRSAAVRTERDAGHSSNRNRYAHPDKKPATELSERVRDALLAHKKLAVSVFILIVLLGGLYGPIQGYYHAIRDAQELQVTQRQIEEEHKNLSDDVNRLQTPEGIRDKAHERGYVSDDENSVSVEGVGNTTTDDKPKERQRPEDPWYTKLFDFIFGYVPADAQE